MKSFIIDYVKANGRKDFMTVHCNDADEAVSIFRNAGVDGWSGCSFKDCEIIKVSER